MSAQPSTIYTYSHTKMTQQSRTITLYSLFSFLFTILSSPFRALGRAVGRRNLVIERDLDVEWEDTVVSRISPALTPIPPPIVAAPPNPAVSLKGSVFDPRRRVGGTLIGGFAAEINQPRS